MKNGNELYAAMAIVATSVGIDFVSGRALAAFYGQMGCASWLGIGLSAVLYGLMTALIVRLTRRCGAQTVGELLTRLPGGGMGKGAYLLYICILMLAGGMLVNSAGNMGALMVPVYHAKLLGSALALLAAGMLAFLSVEHQKAIGSSLIMVLLVFELVLLLFAQLPAAPRYEIELRMKDNQIAALGFALLHTSACLCLSAGTTVRFSAGRVRPVWMGAVAGTFYGLLLTVGNAVLMMRDTRILTLKLPFAALSASLGKKGFYLNAGLGWMFCVFSLYGLIHGFIPVQSRAKHLGK